MRWSSSKAASSECMDAEMVLIGVAFEYCHDFKGAFVDDVYSALFQVFGNLWQAINI